MKLFVDDEWDLEGRYPSEEWVCVRSVCLAKMVLEGAQGLITHLSLDYDLGSEEPSETGGAIVLWLSEQWHNNGVDLWPTESISIHSRNPVGRASMRAYILNPKYNPRPEMFTEGLI